MKPVRALLLFFARLLARAWMCSWRLEITGTQPGIPHLIALLHEDMFVCLKAFRRQSMGVLVSRSPDGDIGARLAADLGYHPIRGSSSRGAPEAFRSMLRFADATPQPLAILMDGPKGPRRRLKPGAAVLAARTGRPIVAASVRAERAWRLGSWDRCLLPYPFSRVQITLSEPVAFPAEMQKSGYSSALNDLAAFLHAEAPPDRKKKSLPTQGVLAQ